MPSFSFGPLGGTRLHAGKDRGTPTCRNFSTTSSAFCFFLVHPPSASKPYFRANHFQGADQDNPTRDIRPNSSNHHLLTRLLLGLYHGHYRYDVFKSPVVRVVTR
jgi:hypothetical protein